jgi:hypothetical protein
MRSIAAELHLAEGTVRSYSSEAISKLGAANRVEAAGIATGVLVGQLRQLRATSGNFGDGEVWYEERSRLRVTDDG